MSRQTFTLLFLGITSGFITGILTQGNDLYSTTPLLFAPGFVFGFFYGGYKYLTGVKSLKNLGYFIVMILSSMASYIISAFCMFLIEAVFPITKPYASMICAGMLGAFLVVLCIRTIYKTNTKFLLPTLFGGLAIVFGYHIQKAGFFGLNFLPNMNSFFLFFVLWQTFVMPSLSLESKK